MAINTKKPPIKETVGAQYICFNTMSEENEWTEQFEEDVEQTKVVKNVSVTENAEATDVYSSGEVYDTDNSQSSTDIAVEVIAFPADTLAKMGEDMNAGDSAIFCPTFTWSPTATRGSQGAPICWDIG